MRRLIASAAALVLLAAVVPSVAANEPDRGAWDTTTVRCPGFLAGDLWVNVDASVDATTAVTSSGFTAWTMGPWGWELALRHISDDPEVVVADATTLTATIPLVDAAGAAAGAAGLQLTLTAAGDPQVAADRWHDANNVGSWTSYVQLYVVTGTLSVAGGTYDVAGQCAGELSGGEYFNTAPNARTSRSPQTGSECIVTNGASTMQIGFDIAQDRFAAGFWTLPGSAWAATGWVDGPLVDGSGTSELHLYDPTTGEPLASTGRISISVARMGDRFTYVQKGGTDTTTYSGELLDFEGAIVIDGGPTFSLGECFGFDAIAKFLSTNPVGPPAVGPAPVNDLPSGAVLLRDVGIATTLTRGAALAYDAPYPCEFDAAGNETPVQNTVWYKFQGTGATATVDTAGSDYDTAASAYTMDAAGAMMPVPGACNEDVALQPFGVSWQASITFPTVAGTWYYVQVGGWPYWETSYGNLKIALR